MFDRDLEDKPSRADVTRDEQPAIKTEAVDAKREVKARPRDPLIPTRVVAFRNRRYSDGQRTWDTALLYLSRGSDDGLEVGMIARLETKHRDIVTIDSVTPEGARATVATMTGAQARSALLLSNDFLVFMRP
jgi:hypothetical protein